MHKKRFSYLFVEYIYIVKIKFYGGLNMDLKFKTKADFFMNLDNIAKDFNENEKKLYCFIKENYKKVAYMNLQQLSVKIDLDTSIIDKFSKDCGFDNYEDFRNELRQVIMAQLTTTDRFKLSLEMENLKIDKILNSVINIEIKNLTELINTINEESLSNIVKEIVNADEVIVVGTRASAPVAIYAEYIFNRIGKKTRKLISGGTESFDNLAIVDRNTLILAFGFARYPKETVKILNFFKKKNFKIISVTDNDMSPLAHFSDIILTVPYESVSFTDFYSVPIVIVNTIVILVSQLDSERSFKFLNEFEDIAKDMGFYF